MLKKSPQVFLPFVVIYFLVLTACTSPQPQDKAQEYIMPPETIITEDIPPIPVEIKETLDPYNNIRSASFAAWNPQGKGMIITTRAGETSQFFGLEHPLEKLKQITAFDEPVSNAVFSPSLERSYFLFLKDVGGAENYQIFRHDLDTGESTMLTDGKSRHMSVLFSKKGDRIAYASNARTGDVFDIWILDPLNPESAKLVYESEWGYYDPLFWYRDGKLLLVVRTLSKNIAQSFLLNTETGEIKDITPKAEGPVYFRMEFVSPDERSFYGITDLDSEFKHLVKLDIDTGIISPLTGDIPWDIQSADITDDFKRLVFVANEGGISRVYLMDIQTGGYEQISQIPEGDISGVKFDKTGTRIAFNLSNARMNGDVFHYDLEEKKLIRWTKSNTAGLDTSHFILPELITYPTFDTENGEKRRIPCFFYQPAKRTERPFPVIIDIHGGPESQRTVSFSSFQSYLVNELGIALLMPNVRGSDGYGKSYLLLDNAEKREDTVKDIGALLDWIATQHGFDKNRVAVMGGSYGGYMVLSSLFHFSDRLCCGVERAGISNFVTFLRNTADYRRDHRRQEYGDERIIGDFLNKISPTTNAHRIAKPLFVTQGKNDPRVPMSESEQIIKDVKKNNVPAWYLLATNEGHNFKKKNNVDFRKYAIVRFFQEFLLKE